MGSGSRGDGGLRDFIRRPAPDLFHKTDLFADFLARGRAGGYETYLRPVLEHRGARAVVEDLDGRSRREVILYCCTDYLGLSRHPEVIRRAEEALRRHGAGIASVPLLAGATWLHRELESELARLVGAEDAVLFPTGHAANIGVIAALCGPGDTVVHDEQIHASVLDGIRLAGARRVPFRHSMVEDLRRALESTRAARPRGGILVAVEGVYGLDGDCPPLAEIGETAGRFGARLLLDDAHGVGVLGEHGEGSCGALAAQPLEALIMGSLSKALGSMGGWLAGPARVIDYLRYFARTIVFSVGLPAAGAAAALAALAVAAAEPERRRQGSGSAARFREAKEVPGFPTAARSSSPIVSIRIGDQLRLREALRALFREGIWAEGLAYPAVPSGEERIRFRITALHSAEDLDQTIGAIERLARPGGVLEPQGSSK